MKLRTRMLISCFLVAALGSGNYVIACECGNVPDAGTSFGAVDAVFAAKVVAVKDRLGVGRRAWFWVKSWFTDTPGPTESSAYLSCCGLETEVQVTTTWKGPTLGASRVVSGRGQGDCGVTFEPGKEYLIYARKNSNGELATDICTRTKPLAEAQDDVLVLNGASSGH